MSAIMMPASDMREGEFGVVAAEFLGQPWSPALVGQSIYRVIEPRNAPAFNLPSSRNYLVLSDAENVMVFA